MNQPLVRLLAQTRAGADAAESIAVLMAIAAITVGILGMMLYQERRARRRLEAEFGQAMQAHQQSHAQAAEAAQQRDQVMFDQHRNMNQLTIDKIRLELQALQTQIKIMETDLRRRDEAGEFHAAMMEKTRLELESLKLHIKEQRKRLDDYGQYED